MQGCRIKLVTTEKFQRLKEKHDLKPSTPQYTGSPYSAETMARIQTKAYTDHVFDCNTGGIQNGKQTTLFHLAPDIALKEPQKIQILETLNKDTLQLRQSEPDHPVRGFITGGHAFGELNQSRGLYDHIQACFKNIGINDISVLWGRKNTAVIGPCQVLYNGDKNTWYVNVQAGDEDNVDVLTLKQLKNTFDKIHLAKGDTLVTQDGKYTANDLSLNPFRRILGQIGSKD